MRNWIVCIALCLAFPALGQAQGDKPSSAAAGDAGLRDLTPDYLIGPEDVLEITVWKEEGLIKQVLVRPDGGISFPLAGDIHAAGKTASQLQREFKLIEQDYGADHLDLVLASGYVKRLLENARVVRFLAQKHPEILAEFQKLSDLEKDFGDIRDQPHANYSQITAPELSFKSQQAQDQHLA